MDELNGEMNVGVSERVDFLLDNITKTIDSSFSLFQIFVVV